MPSSLSREDRLRIMRFACAFAWADLEVRDAERTFIHQLINRMGLQDDAALIEAWLRSPPPPEDVDPTRVPREHRALVLDAARKVAAADGFEDPVEKEWFVLLEQLLAQ